MNIVGLAIAANRLGGLMAAQMTPKGAMHLDLAALSNPDPLQQAFMWLLLRHIQLVPPEPPGTPINRRGSLASHWAMST